MDSEDQPVDQEERATVEGAIWDSRVNKAWLEYQDYQVQMDSELKVM